MALCNGCEVRLSDFPIQVGLTEEEVILFFKNHGVLPSQKICPTCGAECLIRNMNFRCQSSRLVDGIRLRCTFKQSLKANTWLSDKNLSVSKVAKFVFLWLHLEHPRHDYIKSELQMSDNTVVDWSKFCREICMDSLLSNDDILGGPGITVEIDEAEFGRRKNNQGRIIEGSWIIGCRERGTRRSFFVPVQDRSARTLIGIISRLIAPGTTIISDRWKGHDPLINHPQYDNLTENHSLNFIDPDTETHTQNIEGMWREVRSNIPRHGRRQDHMASYLAEFYWKSKFERSSRIHNFFIEVGRQFDWRSRN